MIGRGFALAFVASLGCVPGTPASAFKPDLHFRYTLRAVEAVLEGCPAFGWAARPELAMLLASGTDKEDTSELGSRITNWHYRAVEGFPSFTVLVPLPLLGQADLDAIFEQRGRELHEAPPGEGASCARPVFERAGRVLHYVQDMRVPSHVIPIHHGSVLGDDGFDGYIFDFEKKPLDARECQALAASLGAAKAGNSKERAAILRARLTAASTETQGRLSTVLGDTKCTMEDIFWCVPRPGAQCRYGAFERFGKYWKYPTGPEGKREVLHFGSSPVYCRSAPKRAKYVTDKDYHDYFRTGYRQMLLDSAFFFGYASAIAGEKCGPF